MSTDDRTLYLDYSPKEETLRRWPHATCHKVEDLGFVVRSNEPRQPVYIGDGRNAWSAWREASVQPRQESE
jgi:hypothetical protein